MTTNATTIKAHTTSAKYRRAVRRGEFAKYAFIGTLSVARYAILFPRRCNMSDATNYAPTAGASQVVVFSRNKVEFNGKILELGQEFPTTPVLRKDGMKTQHAVTRANGGPGLLQTFANGFRRVIWIGVGYAPRTENERR